VAGDSPTYEAEVARRAAELAESDPSGDTWLARAQHDPGECLECDAIRLATKRALDALPSPEADEGRTDAVTCPECGRPARRDRRFLKAGRTPFICKRSEGGCGAWMIDENEPVQSEKGSMRIGP
jgi:hypothetical protein